MEVNGTAISLGQKVMASSLPVVLSSDQASIPVAATLSAETTKVIGTVNVAAAQTIAVTQATAANLNVTVAALTNASIVKAQLQDNAGTAITLGQKVMASSVPVALASDQSALTVAQATAANLNATIVQATASNLNAQVVGNVANAATDSGNPVKVGGVYQTTIPALTAGQRGDIQLDSRGALLVSVLDGVRATYSASATNIVPAVTATDVFTITGSATKTVRVIKIGISGVQTAGGIISVLVLKRSTANSAGTSAASAAVPNDSNNAAATATVLSYTANPTLGSVVGSAVRSGKVNIPVSTASSSMDIQEFVFGDTVGQAIVLRGIAQVLAINLNSVTVTGGSLSYYVVWTEE